MQRALCAPKGGCTHVSQRPANSAGVRLVFCSAARSLAMRSVNQANLSPNMFDLMAWPSLILPRLLNLCTRGKSDRNKQYWILAAAGGG